MCRRLNLNQHWGPYIWTKVICLKKILWNFIAFPCAFWILKVVLDSPKRCVEICHVWDVILTGCPNNLAFSRFFTLQVGFFAQTLINKFKNYVIFLTMCNIHKLQCRQRSSMNTKVGYLKTKLSKTVFYCLLL